MLTTADRAPLFAAAGFATELLKQTTPRVKRWFGSKLCYSVGFFRALLLYRAPLIRAEAPGLDVTEPMLLACAANSGLDASGRCVGTYRMLWRA